MGDFDGWTQGFVLSAEEISDDVFTRFEGQCLLPPVNPLPNICKSLPRCTGYAANYQGVEKGVF